MIEIEHLVIAFVFGLIGVFLGNHSGDQATLRNCATQSEAKMVGGGKIKCEVIKEQPK